MTIVDTTKFGIGIAFLVVGLGVFWTARSQRGFGQRKQAGALMLAAGIAFAAIGLGLIEV